MDQVEGVRVIHCWIWAFQKPSFFLRLINYFSFVFSSFWIGIFHLHKPDVIITESPPLFLGITGWLLSLLKQARWVFNISDLWPDSAVWLGVIRHGFWLWLSYQLEGFLYRRADLVSGQSRGILQSIKSRFPMVETFFFPNGADVHLFKPEIKSSHLNNCVGEGVVALYAGLHGIAQGLDQLLSAIQLVKDVPGFKTVLMGDGPLKTGLLEQARFHKLDNVFFLDPLPRGEMPGVLASADFCIVPLGLELPGAVPSKLYEAMSAGRPMVLMARGEAAEIVKNNDCGLVVEPGDVQGLANAIQLLVEDEALRMRLGVNSRRAAVEHYDRMKIVDGFIRFLESNGRP
jgi:glycosyltransferase involved in cell wall biosynthesis